MLPSVDIKLDIKQLKDRPILSEVLQILKMIRPKWLPQDIRHTVLTGGISNHLYAYYLDGKFREDVIIFRIEGEGTELLVDRKRERYHMEVLQGAGIGPPLYCVFNNGIAYGYFHGETVTPDTVRDEKVRKLIAKEFVRLHQVQPDGKDLIPNWLTKALNRLEHAPDGFPDNPEKHKRFIELIPPKHVIKKELEELKDHLDALNSPVIFCHNDLLPGNIIYNGEKESVHFIDYEYSTYNYEHAEISRHFTEYAGTKPSDLTRYPDKPYQIDWIRYYLECKAEENGGSPTDVTERDVEEFYVKVNKFALYCWLTMGIWGLVETKHSNLGFDYLGIFDNLLSSFLNKMLRVGAKT